MPLSGGRDRADDAFDERGLPQLARGDVDAHAHARRPVHHLLARLAQDPVADRRDQAPVLLGGGQEAARAEQALLRVLPARQRLDGDRLAVALEIHDRLVVQAQLVALERAPQAVLDLHPVAQAAAHRAVEDLVGRAAAGLDALQGVVGALHEVGVAVARLDRDADRGGLTLVLELGEDGELVASEAHERLRDVELRLQAGGDLHQHLVPHGVAVRVVDGAEAVQAEQQHHEALPRGPRRRLLEPLGDVVGVDHHAVGRDEHAGHVQPADLAGGQHRVVHLAPDGHALGQRAPDVVAHARPVSAVEHGRRAVGPFEHELVTVAAPRVTRDRNSVVLRLERIAADVS
jgi:hypothetical protein